jgi:hypothetical protein
MTQARDETPNEVSVPDSALPALDHNLITRYIREGAIGPLLSLYNSMKRQRDQAQYLSQAYLNQMIVLHKRLEAATQGGVSVSDKGGEPREHLQQRRELREPRVDSRTVAAKPKAEAKPRRAQAVEIEI